jgi:acetylornithine deacetylase
MRRLKRKRTKKTMQNDVVSLLKELIAHSTVSHQPVDGIAALLAERAEDAGGAVDLIETSPGKVNVIARFGPTGTDGLVISGHMDVVPTIGQAWSSDPFALSERQGKLFGRGTSDMKGFLAAISVAIRRMRTDRLTRELVLIWTHDEEVGCQGSHALIGKDLGPLPSQAWIGEPTNFQMCRMHPGHTTVAIHCTGRAAHSSRPSLGVNAIHLAGRVLAQLEGLSETWTKDRRFEDHLDSPFTVMNVGEIKGGAAVNIVPDSCTLRVGIRPLPGDLAKHRVKQIREILRPVKQHARFLGGDIEVEVEHTAPALLTAEGSPLERHLCPHASTPLATAAPFATDGGNLQDMGIASIVFGPGSIDVAHRADEYIEGTELLKCVQIAEAVIAHSCGNASNYA